jgi:hypothetical protein
LVAFRATLLVAVLWWVASAWALIAPRLTAGVLPRWTAAAPIVPGTVAIAPVTVTSAAVTVTVAIPVAAAGLLARGTRLVPRLLDRFGCRRE